MSVFNMGSGTSEQVNALCDTERGLRQSDALSTVLFNIQGAYKLSEDFAKKT